MQAMWVRMAAGMLLSVGLAAPSQAQQVRADTLIKWRQSAYQVMTWSTSRIRANVEGQFNRDEVIRAAQLLNSLANAGMGTLYPTGTESGSGWHETTVRPELFRNQALVAERAGALARETGAMLNLAASGDVPAIKAQYGRLVQACKNCHEDLKFRE
ncbi:MAG: cytochrome c [Proteobacteria bacterium]|nr:cytochrome c [Pseudomonadota bacterium]